MIIIAQGLLISLNGIITSKLKVPFNQICYAVNKSKEIREKTKDEIISDITEINEHFKETFKFFGMLTIADQLQKIYLGVMKNSEIPNNAEED